MTEQESRGRNRKQLEKDVLKHLIKSSDQILTTQEIREMYNERQDDSAAHQTVKKNLYDAEQVKDLNFGERTGWIIGE